MDNKKPTKDRLKEKAAAVKAKAKAVKCRMKTAAKCAVAFALLLAVAGCATSDPASRLTKAEYGDIKVCVEENVRDVTVNITLGDGAIASADSAGSTETITATPTNEVKPDTNIEVPVNKSGGGAQTVGSVLGDAAASAVKGLVSKAASTDTKSQSTATGAKADCADGSCTTGNCTDGNCTDGNCTTGNCTDCTVK